MFVSMVGTARAREQFLAGVVTQPKGVRPAILASWRRSMLHGLTPAQALPRAVAAINPDSQLLRAARPVLDAKRDVMSGLSGGLTLTDGDGRLLGRWVEDQRFARRLDARQVRPGMSIAESSVGTNSSGISVETGEPALVVGHEHFSDGAVTMTSAGTPIRHPMTRRVVGSLNLTCGAEDTNALLLPWITELVSVIERQLLDNASHRQRVLLDAFLSSAQDARHPVVCLDAETVITNAAASRLLDATDHALIWELASQRLAAGDHSTQLVSLAGGLELEVSCRAVLDGDHRIGALLRLARVADRGRRTAVAPAGPTSSALDTLPGRSAPWRRFAAEVARGWAAGTTMLLTGEAGTGKATAARALAGADATAILDVREQPTAEWLPAVRAALTSGAVRAVVLTRLDLLSAADAAGTSRLLSAGVPASVRVVATAQVAEAAATLPGLYDWPGLIVRVPPLRDRLDDLPQLLATITRRLRGDDGPRWTPEVVQALSRVVGPGNLHSLARTVAATLGNVTGPVVQLKDLPAESVALSTRRRLSGLEQMEAHAISAALQQANGNKREAADALGIARSTLYRKVRALGLDLGSATY